MARFVRSTAATPRRSSSAMTGRGPSAPDAQDGEVVLELLGASKSYRQGQTTVVALEPTDLEVRTGEFMAIMGPSGSGKSTMLQLLGGLASPSTGSVRIGGRDLASSSVRELACLRRETLGFVFQDLNLLPGLTAIENVTLPLELDGVSFRRARTAASQALADVDLEELADRFPDELSGGQRQRVAVARALVGTRRIVLSDEPTGALDTVTGESVLRLLREHTDRGGTSVMVTHDAGLASWADRVVFLTDGRIVDHADDTGPSSLLAGS